MPERHKIALMADEKSPSRIYIASSLKRSGMEIIMSEIRILDKETIDKIAAGEVVERPSSIVKELVENAIDAKATAITIEIKDGGTSFIRITDNGSGIEREQISTAFLRHATSKIKNIDDLNTVSSLGFRGEALSSIAAVAQVELITKTHASFIGTRYVIEGGVEKSNEEIGAPEGTTFIIRNIFYNTPVRRKFLKSNTTEAGYIGDVIEHIAMSHPEVSIRFINNNQNRIHTSGNSKLKDVIYSIYGKDIASNLIEINSVDEILNITGFVGKPIITRGNRNFENYYINGRYIKNKIINKAIEEAYKPYMMQHRYPFVAFHIDINPDLIDVNVHPTKMEIRFTNPEVIYPIVYEAITKALSVRELIPQVSPGKMDTVKKEAIKEKMPEPFEKKRLLASIHVDEPVIPMIKEEAEIKYGTQPNKTSQPNITGQPTKPTQPIQPTQLVESLNNKSVKIIENKIENKAKSEQLSLFDDKLLSEKARIKHKLVGQIFDTYWIIEYDNSMYIIDQHAAHEKVLYERFMNAFKTKEFSSQQINPPIILSLSLREEEMMKKHLNDFIEIGYEIEHFGGNEYAVRAVPDNLLSISKKELLIEMIDSLCDDNKLTTSETISDRIATMSCKAAVKGNNSMSVEEANELIDELLTLENPYNCPHGRPTIISMTKYEIEKKFKRIV